MNLQPIPAGLVLKSGQHESFEAGACLLEVVAHLAGEPWSDHPKCACPVVAAFGRALNDRMPSDEMRTELLLPLVPLIAGSRSTKAVEERRRWMAADFAVREALPRALCSAASFPRCEDPATLLAHAAALQAMAPVTRENWEAPRAACLEARSAAYAAVFVDAADYVAATAFAAASAAADARREVFALAADLLRRMCEVSR